MGRSTSRKPATHRTKIYTARALAKRIILKYPRLGVDRCDSTLGVLRPTSWSQGLRCESHMDNNSTLTANFREPRHPCLDLPVKSGIR